VVLARRSRSVQFLLVLVFGTVLSIGPTTEAYPEQPVAARWAIAIVASVSSILCFRVARLAVVLLPDRAVVRNIFRSYHLPRSAICRVEPPPPSGRLWKAGLLLHRCHGRSVSASAFALGPFDDAPLREVEAVENWLATGDPQPARPKHQAPSSSRSPLIWKVWLAVLALLTGSAMYMIIVTFLDPTG